MPYLLLYILINPGNYTKPSKGRYRLTGFIRFDGSIIDVHLTDRDLGRECTHRAKEENTVLALI